ncbi:MAG: hypothetical protein GX608_08240, partial [Lentisphaerae bacterium]|nr:hypothetical protein [Lentisphaerota bacterium]
MSRSLALDNICLRPARSWGHTEYSLNYHKEFLAKRTGLVPEDADCLKRAYDRFRFDFLFVNNDGLVAWDKGRLTDMGHADYAADGSDQRPPRPCPFSTPEEVWAFDAVEEYGLPDFNEQVAAYENQARLLRNTYPNQLCTGGYYKT